jgi:preprotein translocase subunit YajC
LPGGSPGAARVSGRFCSSTLDVDLSSIGLHRVLADIEQAWLLAQEAAAPPAGDPNAFFRMLLPLVIIFGLFYFLMLRPQKKKEDEFKRLVSDLKENDHIITIGGIHGVVTNVQRDADRVTIRVDESTGTKLRINTSAIARVVTDDDDSSGASSGGKSK